MSNPRPPIHRALPLRLTLVVLSIAIAWAAAGCQGLVTDSIRPGISAGGVDLGGLDTAAARARLAERLGRYEGSPVVLRAADREWRTTPVELGIRLDVDQTFAQARRASEIGLLGRTQIALNGASPVSIEPVVQVDVDKLAAFLDRVGREFNRPGEPARLVVELNGSVKLSPAQTGRQLERDAAAQAIARAAAKLNAQPLALPLKELPPSRTEADLAAARDRAARIVGRPVRLKYGDNAWNLSQEELAALVVMRDEPGISAELMVSVDRARLSARLDKIAEAIDRPVRNPRFDLAADGKLRQLNEGTEGWKTDRAELLDRVFSAVTGDNRTVDVPVKVEKPVAPDPSKLGIKELIEEASTEYAGSVPEKRHNIALAASRLHGIVVAPGELFSFNNGVGRTTLDQGFQIGWGITQDASGAKTVPSVAGGICQVATTLFQSVFWAGYQIEQRNWHLYWIPRYGQPPKGMKGLDATVDEEFGVDFGFVNNSDSYVLIQAKADGSTLTFRLYGTKPKWQVKVDGPVIDQVVPAKSEVVHQDDPTMPTGKTLQIEAAHEGFRATVTRTVTQDGQPRTLKLVSTYQPARNVVLVGTKPVAPTPTPGTPGPAPVAQPTPKPSN